MNIDAKNSKQNSSKSSITTYKKVNASLSNGVYPPQMQGWFNWTAINAIHHTNKLKWKPRWSFQCVQKKHLTEARKNSNLGVEENLLNLKREVCKRANSAVLRCSNPVHSQEGPVSMTALCLAPGNWALAMGCLMSVLACLTPGAMLYQSGSLY